MYKNINENDFIKKFEDSSRKDNFSYEGKKALFDYLKNLEDETGETIELDIVAICCDFSEYKSIREAIEDYGLDSEQELYNNTTVLKFNGGIIVADF